MAEIKRPRVRKARQAFVQAELAANEDMTRERAQATFETLSKSMEGRTKIVQTAGLDPTVRRETKRAIRQYAQAKQTPVVTDKKDEQLPPTFTTAQVAGLLSSSGPNFRSSVNTPVTQPTVSRTQPKTDYRGRSSSSPLYSTFEKLEKTEVPVLGAFTFGSGIPVIGQVAPTVRAMDKLAANIQQKGWWDFGNVKKAGGVLGNAAIGVADVSVTKGLAKFGISTVAKAGKLAPVKWAGSKFAKTGIGETVTWAADEVGAAASKLKSGTKGLFGRGGKTRRTATEEMYDDLGKQIDDYQATLGNLKGVKGGTSPKSPAKTSPRINKQGGVGGKSYGPELPPPASSPKPATKVSSSRKPTSGRVRINTKGGVGGKSYGPERPPAQEVPFATEPPPPAVSSPKKGPSTRAPKKGPSTRAAEIQAKVDQEISTGVTKVSKSGKGSTSKSTKSSTARTKAEDASADLPVETKPASSPVSPTREELAKMTDAERTVAFKQHQQEARRRAVNAGRGKDVLMQLTRSNNPAVQRWATTIRDNPQAASDFIKNYSGKTADEYVAEILRSQANKVPKAQKANQEPKILQSRVGATGPGVSNITESRGAQIKDIMGKGKKK